MFKHLIVIVAAASLVVSAGCQPDGLASQMEDEAAKGSLFVGQVAPAFELPDQDDQPVSLQGLRGKWVVLYFYPADDTPGCTCQATEFTQLLQQFCQMNALIYGVSTDSPESHRQFIEKYELDLNLLSDHPHAVMEHYGAWITTTLGDLVYGQVHRTTFIIDPEGVIRHHWPEVYPEGHAERVRDKLAELQIP